MYLLLASFKLFSLKLLEKSNAKHFQLVGIWHGQSAASEDNKLLLGPKHKARWWKSSCRERATNNHFAAARQHFLIKKEEARATWKNSILDYRLPPSFCDHTTLRLGSSQRRDTQVSCCRKRQNSSWQLVKLECGNLHGATHTCTLNTILEKHFGI